MANTEKIWTNRIKKALVGRKIVGVRYLSKSEQENLYWSDKCIVLELDDGNLLYPSSDDEGNNAGALFTNLEDLPTIPVMR